MGNPLSVVQLGQLYRTCDTRTIRIFKLVVSCRIFVRRFSQSFLSVGIADLFRIAKVEKRCLSDHAAIAIAVQSLLTAGQRALFNDPPFAADAYSGTGNV
jgi:hypothetical protein